MQLVYLCENALEPETWLAYQVDDIREFLMQHYEKFPENARIYHQSVSEVNDITPNDLIGIERLGLLQGPFYVVVYPAGVLTIVVAVVAVAAVAAAYLLMPDIPTATQKTQNKESPNNELSERENSSRINGRIPDVYGTVRSTPDLIAVPYKIFIDHKEVEHAYMCIGRGEYEIQDVRDDTTKISDIKNASVEVYGPNTSPNSGDAPIFSVGDFIDEQIVTAQRIGTVNGQTLDPTGEVSFESSDITFEYPNKIKISPDADGVVSFLDEIKPYRKITVSGTATGENLEHSTFFRNTKFIDGGYIQFVNSTIPNYVRAGTTLSITGAVFNYEIGTGQISLSGTYVVASRATQHIRLEDPWLVNSNWELIAGHFTDDRTPAIGLTIEAYYSSGGLSNIDLDGVYEISSVHDYQIALENPGGENDNWSLLSSGSYNPSLCTLSGGDLDIYIGPFIIEDMEKIYCNFVATNGLYKSDSDGNQHAINVSISVQVTPVNDDDDEIGETQTYNTTVEGSDTETGTRANTLKIDPPFEGRCKIIARRTTDKVTEGSGITQEVKWRDCYAIKSVNKTHFGNVTTVQSITYATDGALAVKKRKLNMEVTRKIPQRISGNSFSGPVATRHAADILVAVCTDPYIGGYSLGDLDLSEIYRTTNEIERYFGTSKAVEFCYTFDKDELSFEETVTTIASAVFCNAYRQGSTIKWRFEQATEDSILLFNHRNKLPGSETRTVSFENQDENDGVEYEWIDPDENDIVNTFYLPMDQSAYKPRKVESTGVRNYFQAHQHARRLWQKIQHQHVITEFKATEEANLLVIADRILVADNTRAGIQDGQVDAQNGLELFLSQDIVFEPDTDYIIFLQHFNGTVESIPIIPGTATNSIVLTKAPHLPLVLDTNNFAQATYQIVPASDEGNNAFVVSGREDAGKLVSKISAVNYDFRYYMQDGLNFWWSPKVEENTDVGPGRHIIALPDAGFSLTNDAKRGLVHVGISSDAFLTPSSDTLIPTESYTKSAWFYADNGGHIISTATSQGDTFAVINNELIAKHNGQGITSSDISINTWHHGAVTYHNGKIILFVDGKQKAEATIPQRSLDSLLIAGHNNGNGFIGKLDDVRLYSRALTNNEIRSIYRATKV